MMEKRLSEKYDVYYYVSTRANSYTPAKTIYVCAPKAAASSYEAAEKFAQESGWLKLAEEDGAVLVLPIVKKGWEAQNPVMIAEFYDETRKIFKSKSGDSIPGRDGFIWCWETLVYLVGYGEGAVFAGNAAVATPNRFAGVALVNGVPKDYTPGASSSDHWLVANVSEDYQCRYQEIPVCLWLLGADRKDMKEAFEYFSKSNKLENTPDQVQYDGIDTELYKNPVEEANQIRISIGDFSSSPGLAKTIMEQFFQHYIRWKNAPDGTPKPYLSKSEFYTSKRYIHSSFQFNNLDYEYHTYLPEGMEIQDLAGLPVVFSVHGRGEPAWIFSTKNGWDKLADETKGFILVLPDSPQNIWLLERDGEVFGYMIEQLYERYAIDKSRVYLTGFSNGGMITRQVGNHYPELFAAISPWSAPFVDSFEELLEKDYELPCFICAGDNDDKVPLWDDLDSLLENMLKANKCELSIADLRNPMKFIPDDIRDSKNYYTKENKYTDGDRMTTYCYKNAQGQTRVCFTLLKDMPHGAVYDQSRAAWDFLKQFRRIEGAKEISEIV